MLKLFRRPPTAAPSRTRSVKVTCSRSHATDVVIIGSGIGGLCCAALLAKYGFNVTVCESHTIPGGAAHAYVQRDKEGREWHFEVGPSLYSGMAGTGKTANPLGLVLQAVGEPLDLIRYENWNVFLPEGQFLTKIGAEDFNRVLAQLRGPEAVAEWKALGEAMKPWSAAATVICPLSLRSDPGVLITAVAKNFGELMLQLPRTPGLVAPFSKLVEPVVKDPFILRWLDLLSFLLSGLPANGTIAAEVAFMFNEWYRPDATLEFPRGGAMAMINALVRAVEKKGGKVLLGAHVEEVLIEDGRAAGVRLRGGDVIKAGKATVTNVSVWDTPKLLKGPMERKELPAAVLSELDTWEAKGKETPALPSFMHLHIGFDATGLPPDLEIHHIIVNRWGEGGKAITEPQNVVLCSIASVLDPSLAPAGHHVMHLYTPATEPYHIWEGLDRKSDEYRRLKEERSQVLWAAAEKVIPDIRQRVKISSVGTPLTHERFLRKHRGTYGPGIQAGKGTFPGTKTPVEGLWACGECTFPGIGLPAVAASGAVTANTLAPLSKHLGMLEELGL